jgi:hypothetical protein
MSSCGIDPGRDPVEQAVQRELESGFVVQDRTVGDPLRISWARSENSWG